MQVCGARCWHWLSSSITLHLTWIHSLLTGLDWLAKNRSPLPLGQWDYKQGATPTQDFHGCWGVKLWVLMLAQRAFSALSWPSGNNPEVPKEAGQEKQFSDSKIRSWRKGKPHLHVSNTSSWRAELHSPDFFFFLIFTRNRKRSLGGKSWADHD